jgi:hypothetical protein
LMMFCEVFFVPRPQIAATDRLYQTLTRVLQFASSLDLLRTFGAWSVQ